MSDTSIIDPDGSQRRTGAHLTTIARATRATVVEDVPGQRVHAGRSARRATASVTPAAIAAPPRTRRSVGGSPRMITPAVAANSGAASCTTAACSADSDGSAAYHSAYPIPEASAPDATASAAPP